MWLYCLYFSHIKSTTYTYVILMTCLCHAYAVMQSSGAVCSEKSRHRFLLVCWHSLRHLLSYLLIFQGATYRKTKDVSFFWMQYSMHMKVENRVLGSVFHRLMQRWKWRLLNTVYSGHPRCWRICRRCERTEKCWCWNLYHSEADDRRILKIWGVRKLLVGEEVLTSAEKSVNP